jgi:molecular chaperone DnaK (HSP70)
MPTVLGIDLGTTNLAMGVIVDWLAEEFKMARTLLLDRVAAQK